MLETRPLWRALAAIAICLPVATLNTDAARAETPTIRSKPRHRGETCARKAHARIRALMDGVTRTESTSHPRAENRSCH